MKFKELCERLNNNIEEKKLYFENLNSETLLKPLFNEGILTFDNLAGGYVLSYIERLLLKNEELKPLIIEIINTELSKQNLNLSYGNYDCIIKFITKYFEIDEIENKINYTTLLSMENAPDLCKEFLNNDISKTKKIYKDCIKTLIQHKPYNEHRKRKDLVHSKYDCGMYDIKQVFKESPYKENLSLILQKKEIFELLLNEYKNIYLEFKKNDLELLQRQCIDTPITDDEHFLDFDVRNIILDYLSIYIDNNNDNQTIKQLLESDILMLNKLGLYGISQNLEENKENFITFFNNLNSDKQLLYCTYEIMTILENIDEDIAKKIYNKFEKFSNHTKYRLLHAVKTCESLKKGNEPQGYLKKLKDEFDFLKAQYGNEEIPNPKLLFKFEISQPKLVSPISEKAFEQKSINEQIDYINKYTEPEHNFFTKKNNSYESESELKEVFKKAMSKNINGYLLNDDLLLLKKDNFMSTVFEVISEAIENNNDIPLNKVITLLDTYKSEKYKELFHYYRCRLISSMIDSNKINDLIPIIKILKNFIIEAKEDEIQKHQELVYTDSYSSIGKYLKLYLIILAKDNSLYKKEYYQFLKNNFGKTDNLHNELFYYNWGKYYSWLKGISEYNISSIKNKNLKKALIEGFLNNNSNNINVFYELKDDLLEYFGDVQSSYARKNLIYDLIYIKFVKNNNEIFNLFKSRFSEKDNKDFFWNTLYPKRNPKYNPTFILEYLQNEVQGTKIPQILLVAYNEYLDENTFANEINNLKVLFLNYKNKDRTVREEIGLNRFLEILTQYMNSKFEAKYSDKIFNLLNALIPVFNEYNYRDQTNAKYLLIAIKKYYEISKDVDNCRVLLNVARQTTNLIPYSKMFVDFGNEHGIF